MEMFLYLILYFYAIYVMITYMHMNIAFDQWSYYCDKYFKRNYDSIEELHVAENSYDMLVDSWGLREKW